MIVNMPPVGGSAAGSPPNNNNNNNNNTTNNNTTNGYNFLKRKYVEQELSLGQDFESLESSNPWKKRHLDAYDAGDLQFHLQMDQPAAVKDSVSADPAAPATGSSFINDLFAYDATLLVPTPTPTAHYSTHCPSSSSGGAGAAGGGGGGGPLEDNGGWQAGDLLELDHRYNSGLQAELGQLNATIPPPPPQQQHHQQQQQNPVPTGSPSFLFPQKQRIVTTGRRTSSGSGSGSNGVQEATETDFEDKNLSWLLNFKFDEFPHLSPHNQAGNGNGQPVVLPEGSAPPPGSSTTLGHSPCNSASPTPAAASLAGSTSASAISASATNSNHSLISDQRARSPRSCASAGMPGGAGGVSSGGGGGVGVVAGTGAAGGPAGGPNSNKTGRKFEELVMEVTSELDGNDMIVAEHVVVEDTTSKA